MKAPAALLAALAGLALAAPLSPDQTARAERLASGLRCPVCSGIPITESTADIAVQMRREVREQVAAGRSDREIRGYFASRFGGTVLLDPPKEGVNLVLWGLPLAALLGGGGLLARYLRASKGARSETATEGVSPELLERVRRDAALPEREGAP